MFTKQYKEEILKNVLKTIALQAEAIEYGATPFMFSFVWRRGLRNIGHAVIANGYELMPNGEHRIEVVDANTPLRYAYVYIREDYSNWRFEDGVYSGLGLSEDSWNMIRYSDFDKFDKIAPITDHPDYSSDRDERQNNNSIFVSIINPLLFSILNSLNQSLEYTENGIFGDLVPKSIDFTVGANTDQLMGTSLIFELEKSELFSFVPEDDNISFSLIDEEVYTYISTTGSPLIEVDLGSKISIKGLDVTYEMYVPNTTQAVGLIKIVDEDTGNVKLEHTENGILLSADSLENVTVEQIFMDKKTVIEFTTDKTQVLIKEENEEEEIEIKLYVSENEDGVFDTVLVDTKTIETSVKEQSEEDSRKETPRSKGFIVFIGSIVLITIVVTIVVVVKKKKKK